MSNMENNNSAISNPENDNIQNSNKVNKVILNDSRFFFGNMNGLIKDNYIKYFNLICFELLFTFIFAIIYYLLLIDNDNHFVIPSYLKSKSFFDNRLLIALFISINFQSTIANVYVKTNDLLSISIINIQIIETMFLALLFIIV